MDFNKAITTIAEYICVTLIVLSIIIYFIVAEKIDVELKQNKINELTNKVEQQIELIDALQQ